MNYFELDILKDTKSICIIGHIEPDPDALSSMVVLKHFLKNQYNVEYIDLCAQNEVLSDGMLAILGKDTLIQNPQDCKPNYDTAIMMDSPNIDRLGVFKSLFENARHRVVIDHHATNLYQGNINIVEICSSTCEIVYSIIKEFGKTLSNEEKGKIYAGIITDTNNFSVGEIKERTFKICSEICENIKSFFILKHN